MLIKIVNVSEQIFFTEKEIICGLPVSAYVSCKLSGDVHVGDSDLHNFLSSLHFLS